jgi:hypothetical protein
MCIELLLTAQMLFALASEHNTDNRFISEEMEVQRGTWYMKQYRLCIREESNLLKGQQ